MLTSGTVTNSHTTDFQVYVPAIAFEKADAPAGQRRRIAGIISTDEVDQQNERLLQDGLNFDSFLKTGAYNDDHQQGTVHMLGYPTSVKRYEKGETLPDGSSARANLTWAEGFLCGAKGRDVWELARDLEGSGRTLGFSVEGAINSRDSGDRNIVTSADVQNCAVCIRPVNQSCTLVPLAKSLRKAHDAAKAFTLGTVPSQSDANPIPQLQPNVPKTGDGVGQVLSSIFSKKKERLRKRRKKLAKPAKKSSKTAHKSLASPEPILLNEEQALKWIRKAVSGVDEKTARAFVHTAQRFVALGLA